MGAAMSARQKVKNPSNRGADGLFDTAENTANSTPLADRIKAAFLAGRTVCAIDFPEHRRAEALGVIATLRDQFPITQGWRTVRQSHLSETRLRARTYLIRGEFLRGEVSHA
jgi:hypothetical protein